MKKIIGIDFDGTCVTDLYPYVGDNIGAASVLDEGFEEYKKFLSDPDQKKFCFKGYYYVEVKEQDDKELLGAMGRVVYE